MKLKIIILTWTFLMFTSLNAYAKKDCSKIKKLSKDYLACKASNLKSSTTGLGLDTSNIKEKKTLADWFKKKK